MNRYTDFTANIETSRNRLRRIARNDDQEFSKESIINVMEKFVKTVNAMEETILVPCRLMDLQVGDDTDTVAPVPKEQQLSYNKKKGTSTQEILNAADLFNLYNTLNSVKVSLLWGKNSGDDLNEQDKDAESEITSSRNIETETANNEQIKEQNIKGHIRRPSTVSMSSSNSTSTISDSESEISNENDSGIESEANQDNDKSLELAKECRTHLNGLHRCLAQMTEAAIYLTARYQSHVGPV